MAAMSTVAVLLAYHDVPAARRFFMTALGFAEDWADNDDSGTITRSHLRLGAAEVMIDRPGVHSVRSPRELGGVTQLIVIGVDDIHAHYEAATAAGAQSDGAPTKQSWGGTSYTVTDSEGYLFEFYEPPS
jgi:uncharacterized glyoxalase superfamily protein PhnB